MATNALPDELGLNPGAVAELAERAQQIVTKGKLPSLQIALARHGRIAVELTFGEVQTCVGIRPATNDTLYQGFSTTKAVIAAAIWLLVEEQQLEVTAPVVQWVPEFGANGKQDVRIEQLLTHTAGFPSAPFRAADWGDRELRLAQFAEWELEWEPGSRFAYHAASSMWVVAEIIERCTKMDFREFVRSRILEPLRLDDFHLGLPPAVEERVAHLVWVGKMRSAESRSAAAVQPPVNDAPEEKLAALYNSPAYHAVGVPGGGGIMTASNLALFYQGLLQGGPPSGDRLWPEKTLAWALEVRTGELIDPMTGKAANRALGVVIAGDQDRLFRGFSDQNSAKTYGHLGMGGQVGWADPDSGLSFAFLTNGHERDALRAGMRAMSMSQHAVACVRE